MSNPIVGNPVNFPQRTRPLVDGDTYNVTTPWYLLFQAFFDRTGGGTGEVTLTVQSGVVDAGGGQAGATALKQQLNTVVGAGGGVSLPPYTAGKPCLVFNTGAAGTTVYPAPGPNARIDALAPDAGFPVPAGKCQVFWFESTTQIRTMQLA